MDDNFVEELFKKVLKRKTLDIREFVKLHAIDVTSIRNKENRTLLHVAAGYGRPNLVQYLVSEGVNINAQDIEGQAALHNACCHGHQETVEKLIRAGALVDIEDNQGWTPLHFVLARKVNEERITADFWAITELLLEAGANPHLRTKSGKSCLDRIKDDEDKRRVLLAWYSQLEKCAQNRKTREAMIDRCLPVQDYFELVLTSDVEVLNRLSTPMLINSRVDGRTPLHCAAGHNRLEVARLLLERGAQVNANDKLGRIPLHNAAKYGHDDMIEFLVQEAGSDVNKQDQEGLSPLHVAAASDKVSFLICEILVNLEANKNMKCKDGKTPYDCASDEAKLEVLGKGRRTSRVTDQGVYIYVKKERVAQRSDPDPLIIEELPESKHDFKMIPLDDSDWRYQEVKRRMLNSIEHHTGEAGGLYSTFEILSIELNVHKIAWNNYQIACKRIENFFAGANRNEKLLFHGSKNVDAILDEGFHERYAKCGGMFGAGIYFAEHSSKSNQYAFGFDKGCKEHKDKSCYLCERTMICAQVALGRSFISKIAIPKLGHDPPGHNSVTGSPGITEGLKFPEYVIFRGDQAYPLFVIRYRIRL